MGGVTVQRINVTGADYGYCLELDGDYHWQRISKFCQSFAPDDALYYDKYVVHFRSEDLRDTVYNWYMADVKMAIMTGQYRGPLTLAPDGETIHV